MLEACQTLFPECGGVIGAAAPSDYRPAVFSEQKIKKQNSEDRFVLQLVETPDILATLGKMKRRDQWIVGFALETERGQEHAVEKLRRKNCDLIALNSPDSIDSESTMLQILDATGLLQATLTGTKQMIARDLVELAVNGAAG